MQAPSTSYRAAALTMAEALLSQPGATKRAHDTTSDTTSGPASSTASGGYACAFGEPLLCVCVFECATFSHDRDLPDTRCCSAHSFCMSCYISLSE